MCDSLARVQPTASPLIALRSRQLLAAVLRFLRTGLLGPACLAERISSLHAFDLACRPLVVTPAQAGKAGAHGLAWRPQALVVP